MPPRTYGMRDARMQHHYFTNVGTGKGMPELRMVTAGPVFFFETARSGEATDEVPSERTQRRRSQLTNRQFSTGERGGRDEVLATK